VCGSKVDGKMTERETNVVNLAVSADGPDKNTNVPENGIKGIQVRKAS
jgi:hypothetical protein